METIRTVAQLAVGLGILNVWLVRFGWATDFRGGSATNMKEEFAVYGLPGWSVGVVGAVKVILALLLIAGVWLPRVTLPAALGMAALMFGALVMHLKVKDPPRKSLPALLLLVLSLLVALV